MWYVTISQSQWRGPSSPFRNISGLGFGSLARPFLAWRCMWFGHKTGVVYSHRTAVMHKEDRTCQIETGCVLSYPHYPHHHMMCTLVYHRVCAGITHYSYIPS